MQTREKTTRTVGQVFPRIIKKRSKAWERGKDIYAERSKKFPSIKFLRNGKEENVDYRENECERVLDIYRIISLSYTKEINFPPSFPIDATYEDVLFDIQHKIELIFKEEKKSYDWDAIFYDGKDIVLVEYLDYGPLYIPLDTIYSIDDHDMKRAYMYIIGALIAKYNIPTYYNEESELHYYIDMTHEIDDLDDESDIDDEDKKIWARPKEIESLSNSPVGYEFYGLAQECIKVYTLGNNNLVEKAIAKPINVIDDLAMQNLIMLFETFLELDEKPFSFHDLTIKVPVEDEEENYRIEPQEYCSIIPTIKGATFDQYEAYLNDRYGNNGSLPLCIEKRFTLNGVETNRPLKDSVKKYCEIVSLIHDI